MNLYQSNTLCAIASILLISTINGCSSNPSNHSRQPTVNINQAKTNPAKHQGRKVTWGGTIVKVKNYSTHSLIEVLKRPLSGSEPDDNKKAQGRFLVKVSEFVDPIEYKAPSRVTVSGVLQGVTKGKVGNYPYTYPLIKANKVWFWQGKKAKPVDPYWWDYPFYSPFPYYNRRLFW